MNIDIHLVTLVLGILTTTFGALMLFSNTFINFMKAHLWINEDLDRRNWSPEGARRFNKYGRGLGAFIGGIILLAFSLAYYLNR